MGMPDVRFRCAKCGEKMVVDSRACGRSMSCPQCRNALSIPHLQPRDPWKKERDREIAQMMAHGEDLARVDYQESNDYPEDSGDPCLLFDGVIFSITGRDPRFPSYQDMINAGLWHDQCLCGVSMVDELIDKEEIDRQAK